MLVHVAGDKEPQELFLRVAWAAAHNEFNELVVQERQPGLNRVGHLLAVAQIVQKIVGQLCLKQKQLRQPSRGQRTPEIGFDNGSQILKRIDFTNSLLEIV